MAAPLASILASIEQASSRIAAVEFDQPQIFVNALLKPHEITTLIRDTEAHERALFSIAQPATTPRAVDPSTARSRRRTTVTPASMGTATGQSENQARLPRPGTAVSSLLGGDLARRIQRAGGGGDRPVDGTVDVDLLLQGAERLCDVYPIPGASEKIDVLRARWTRLAGSISQLEEECEAQAGELGRLGRRSMAFDSGPDRSGDGDGGEARMTADDFRREEDAIRELERKKAILESRLKHGQVG